MAAANTLSWGWNTLGTYGGHHGRDMSWSLSRAAGRWLVLGTGDMLGHIPAGDTSLSPSQVAEGWPQLLAYPGDEGHIGDSLETPWWETSLSQAADG